MNIDLPAFGWQPRPYQIPLYTYIEQGGKRAVIKWHRRAGKDDVCLKIFSVEIFKRIGNYWFMLPEKEQARKAIWTAVNPHTGRKRIDEAFPHEIRKRINNQEMYIEFINGSTFQLLGSDSYDSHVGATPVGIVFSEYALSNPSAWDYLSPMLLENNGFVIFNSTVRGTNHFYQLGEYARNELDWFYQQVNADESDVFTPEQLEGEKRRLCAQRGDEEGLAIYRQEYFNDPNAAIPGAYYGSFMSKARDEGRIGIYPHNSNHPVYTAWDLGVNDSNAIWFIQMINGKPIAIDYYTNNNMALNHYVKLIKDKPYIYKEHLLPHDAGNRTSGMALGDDDNVVPPTIEEQLNYLGLMDTRVVPRTPSLMKQISDVRSYLPRAYFNEATTKHGIDSIISYHREWDDKLKVFKDHPKHDWASHGASAFATFCQGYESTSIVNLPKFANTKYDVYDYNNVASYVNNEYNIFG